ncbi:hypothetical protein MP638_003863, partial [Amoeboaphelidium occidentale]
MTTDHIDSTNVTDATDATAPITTATSFNGSQEAPTGVDVVKEVQAPMYKVLVNYGCFFSIEEIQKAIVGFDQVKQDIQKIAAKPYNRVKDMEVDLKPFFYDIVDRKDKIMMDGLPLLTCLAHQCKLKKKHLSGGVYPFICRTSNRSIKMWAVIELYFDIFHKASEVSLVASIPPDLLLSASVITSTADLTTAQPSVRQSSPASFEYVPPTAATSDLPLAPVKVNAQNISDEIGQSKDETLLFVYRRLTHLFEMNEIIQLDYADMLKEVSDLKVMITELSTKMSVLTDKASNQYLLPHPEVRNPIPPPPSNHPPISNHLMLQSSLQESMTLCFIEKICNDEEFELSELLIHIQRGKTPLNERIYSQDQFLFRHNDCTVGMILPSLDLNQSFANCLWKMNYRVVVANYLTKEVDCSYESIISDARSAFDKGKFRACCFLTSYLKNDYACPEVELDLDEIMVLYNKSKLALKGNKPELKAEAKRPGSHSADNNRNVKQPRLNRKPIQGNNGKPVSLNRKDLKYSVMNSLKLMFLNLQGNVAFKLPTLMRSFFNDHDIIIIAETWHDYSFNSICPEWVIAHSHKRVTDSAPRESGRNHGGVLFLLRPSLKHLISKIEITTFTVTVKLNDLTVMGLYLPPNSLNLDDIKVLFESGTNLKPDILVGDFNFDPLNKKAESKPLKERKFYLNDLISRKYNSQFVKPINGELPNDHVFSRRGLGTTVNIVFNVPIPTDHKHGLSATIPFSSMNMEGIDKHLVRFNLSRLDDDGCSSALQRQYVARVSPQWLLKESSEIHDDYVLLIESANKHLVKSITGSCCTVIGRKNNSISTSTKPKSDNRDICELAKDFKRDQKVRSNFILQSRNESLSALEDVTEYFSEIFQQDKNHIEKQLIHSTVRNPNDDIHVILPYFSEHSVESILKSYGNTKSCGKDGIHVKVLKLLATVGICKHLSRLFHLCLTHGYTPSAWNQTVTMPIPKVSPEGGALTIDQCRPIGLTCMFRRIFESCLVNGMTLKNSVSEKLVTNYGQGGFKRDSSTILQALVFHDMQFSQKGIIVLVDYRWAFDGARLYKLHEDLRSKGLSDTFISLLQSLYCGCSTQIVVNGALTDKISQYNGLIQGGPS